MSFSDLDSPHHGMIIRPEAEHTRSFVRQALDRISIITIAPTDRDHISTVEPDNFAEEAFLVFSALTGQVHVGGVKLTESQLVVLTEHRVKIEVPANSALIGLRVPADSVGPHGTSMSAVVATPIAAADGVAGLVFHLLRGLAQGHGCGPRQSPAGVAQHVIGLVSLMCAHAARAVRTDHDEMLERAKMYIEESLGELDLGPDRVAAALHVSTRTLHRVFAREGLTINGWTRMRRLERCRIELLDESQDSIPVSAIGARWGIWNAAHFSRVFKAAYGLSPLAFRRTARHAAKDHTAREPISA